MPKFLSKKPGMESYKDTAFLKYLKINSAFAESQNLGAGMNLRNLVTNGKGMDDRGDTCLKCRLPGPVLDPSNEQGWGEGI